MGIPIPSDYQLVEKEDNKGFNRLQLFISSRIGNIDEATVLRKFMVFLKHAEASPESWSQSGTAMWKQSGMVQVKREFPIPTASGKIVPFYLSRAQKTEAQNLSVK